MQHRPAIAQPDFVSQPTAAPAWRWLRDGPLALLVGIIAFAAFANSLRNGYVYDDVPMIRENPRLNSPGNLRAFFGTSYWGDTVDNSQLYRPLTLMSFAVDRALFGPEPAGIHALNVLANGLVSVLIYVFVFKLLGRRELALVAALLFAIHPVHTEVVANGVGRAELYAAVTMLAAMLLHLEYARRREAGVARADAAPVPTTATSRGRARRRAARAVAERDFGATARGSAMPYLVGAVGLYFISLLFKESAAVLPAILIVLEWMILERGDFRPLLRRPGRFLAYVLPLAIYLAMRLAVVGADSPAIQEVMANASPAQRLLFANQTMLRYVGQLICPLWLCAEYSDYQHMVAASPSEPLAIASLLAWPACALLVYWLYRRREHVLLFGLAWFCLTMLPVSNLIVRIGTIRADRLLYLPSFGFGLIVAVGIIRASQRMHWTAAYGLLAALLTIYAWRTVARNRDWYSQETLWRSTITHNPGSAIAWGFVGDIHRAKREFAPAEAAYQRSFELRDGAGFFYPESHNNYAQMCLERHNGAPQPEDRAEAERHYRLVLSQRPRQYVALLNLGELLLHQDATRGESIDLIKRAIAEKPQDFRGYVNLCQAYKLAGQFEPALQAVDGAIRLDPNGPDWWSLRAEILGYLGRQKEAQEALQKAASLRPR